MKTDFRAQIVHDAVTERRLDAADATDAACGIARRLEKAALTPVR